MYRQLPRVNQSAYISYIWRVAAYVFVYIDVYVCAGMCNLINIHHHIKQNSMSANISLRVLFDLTD